MKKYSQSERKSYKKGFLAGLFASKNKNNSRKKVKIPKNATESQRHNILMRDDPDYLVAFRAARRSASGLDNSSEYEKNLKLFRHKYYSETKNRTEYGKYLISKFSD